MDFARFVARLTERPDYRGQMAHVEILPAREARYGAPPVGLHPRLAETLKQIGIERWYAHQSEALAAIGAGHDVVVVTPTASGKSLCYQAPVLDAVLKEPRTRSLWLFPTKALAQDQLGKLRAFGLRREVRCATFDGDTPTDDRRFIKASAHIVLSNPDMLHLGILPNHTQWSTFLRHLRYVVLDEIHAYRGVFGSHVAMVLRRLERLSAYYGARPQFICCSATIANPGELAFALTGREHTVVSQHGAPAGKRTFVLWNPPPLEGGEQKRRSTLYEAASLFTYLVSQYVRCLAFARTRRGAELLARQAHESFRAGGSTAGERVRAYRAGYTPEQRREIERGLFHGELLGVAATNALELGVDIGDLEATLLVGYPGTIASTWQQAGRAGRGGGESLTILIAQDDPLDQFLVRNPGFLFGSPVERAIVDTGNRRIAKAHLACAAHEWPLMQGELGAFGPAAGSALEELLDEGELRQREGRCYFVGEGYPAGRVSIRSAELANVAIRVGASNGPLLGTVEKSRALLTVYPGAIYLHQGESYLVMDLDLDQGVAVVCEEDADYYTEPREDTDIRILQERLHKDLPGCAVGFGEVVVTSQVLGFRKKRVGTDTVLDVVDLDLPAQIFETEAVWLVLPPDLIMRLLEQDLDFAGAIHALEHASIGMMPLLSMCDRWDVGGVSTPLHPDTGRATIFVYDGYPGGAGIAEAGYHDISRWQSMTLDAIRGCRCSDGCPACVHSPKCGNNNQPLDKAGAVYLLQRILEG